MAIGQGFHAKPSPTLGSLPAGLKVAQRLSYLVSFETYYIIIIIIIVIFSTHFISLFNNDKTYYTAARVLHKDKILTQWYRAKGVIFRRKLQHKL